MRQPPIFTSWLITCFSAEEAQKLQKWLSGQINLNRILMDDVLSFSKGAVKALTVPHLLGDYFEDIRILPPSSPTPASFRLVFHRLPQAGRFWKDLMVNLVQEIEARSETTSLRLDYKGDQEPDVIGVNP